MSINFFHPELVPPDNPEGPPKDAAPPEPAQTETTPVPERKFAGKYKTPEDLEQGYWESQREAMRIMAENQALKAQAAQPHAPPSQPLAPLEDYGIPPHVIQAAIQAEVDAQVARRVDQKFQEAFAPMVQGMSARTNVSRRYPDFEAQAGKISEHIGSDPSLTERYNRMSQSDPEMAMEWAYLEYARSAKPVTAAESPTNGALPKGGPAQRVVPGQDNQEELSRARKYYEVMKDPRPYLRARFRDLIPDSHFEER